ncbi:MAG: N-acetylmuramoyl-L-alanine amidase [Firmicutes bacterium]|nr:N-acetylmuramoyl-L-alanine amidase [Bacillota bacterium]
MENDIKFNKAAAWVTILCCLCSLLSGSFFGIGGPLTADAATSTITETEIEAGLSFCAEYPVALTYEGEKITFESKDVPPVIITPKGEQNGRTLIPARALFEKMGATVEWDGDNRAVTVRLADTSVRLIIGSDEARITKGKDSKVTTVKLDVPALIIDHDHDTYGSTMVPVRFIAESIGAEVGFDETTRTVTVKAPAKATETTEAEKPAKVGTPSGVSIEDLPGATGTKAVAADTVDGLFPKYTYEPLPAFTKNAAKKLIAIDPGHGGKDSGAVAHAKQADQLYEKDVNLPVALKLAGYLEAAGGQTYLTRSTDKSVYIYDRPVLANEADADFYVSVHNNSTEKADKCGSMTIYADKVFYGMNDEGRAITIASRAVEWAVSNPAITFDLDGKPVGETEEELYGITSGEVAKKVLSNLMESLGTEKAGLLNKNEYIVINSTRMPAIIIEGAYLSNEGDLAKLRTDEYINRYAYSAAKAIIESFNKRYPD